MSDSEVGQSVSTVVPNLGVAEHFKGGREAVVNATVNVNVDRTRYRSDCFDECC